MGISGLRESNNHRNHSFEISDLVLSRTRENCTVCIQAIQGRTRENCTVCIQAIQGRTRENCMVYLQAIQGRT